MESYVPGSEVTPIPQSLGSSSLSAHRPSTIRPLTAAYQASSGVNQV